MTKRRERLRTVRDLKLAKPLPAKQRTRKHLERVLREWKNS